MMNGDGVSEREGERKGFHSGMQGGCLQTAVCLPNQTKPSTARGACCSLLCCRRLHCTLKQRAFLPLFPTTPGHTAHTIHLLHFLPGLWATYYPSVSVTSPPPPPPPPRLRPSLAMSGLYSQGFSPARNLSPQIRSNPDADRYGRGAAPRRAHVFL
jgi:hypothetical protein